MRLNNSFSVIIFIFFQIFTIEHASAEEWHKVLTCNDELVVDKISWNSTRGHATTRQLVLRNPEAIQYFLSSGAINQNMINASGEFIYGGIQATSYNSIRFQSACDPTNNICYVVRKLDQSSYRIEAWRTAYSKFGPQGLVADWIFHDCSLSENY